jgi:hypothetical protein
MKTFLSILQEGNFDHVWDQVASELNSQDSYDDFELYKKSLNKPSYQVRQKTPSEKVKEILEDIRPFATPEGQDNIEYFLNLSEKAKERREKILLRIIAENYNGNWEKEVLSKLSDFHSSDKEAAKKKADKNPTPPEPTKPRAELIKRNL